MDRWAENCRLRWSKATVPCLLRSGWAPSAYGISPTTVLLHTSAPCAHTYLPRLLRPTEDFWTATLLPDGNVSCQPLQLPGIDPAQALRFAAFDARSRTLSVLLDDPDGTPTPATLLQERAATSGNTREWDESGVCCQEGAVSIRQFRLTDQPDSPPSCLVLEPLELPPPLAREAACAVPGRVHYDPTRDGRNHAVFELLGLGRRPERVGQRSDGRHRVEVVRAERGGDMYANTYVVRDEGSGLEVGRLEARHHPNSTVQAIAGDLLLIPDEFSSGEDAFYNEMRLFNWRTGALLRRVPLAGYIETEWHRGLLPGSSQTFFTVGWVYSYQPQAPEAGSEGEEYQEPDQVCMVFFLSPQPGEGAQAPVDDGQVEGGVGRGVQAGWAPAAEGGGEEVGAGGDGGVAGV